MEKFTKRDIAMMSYGYSLRMADEIINEDTPSQTLTPEEYQRTRKSLAKELVNIIGSEFEEV